ncbi:retropepsin-like aspartic protease family protein [Aurantiacibacter sediminis]|uniref:TIGR02281 family clan AA aspartic protease n=1 Tax=Aurantiacibacter sediminis TaxID=2793064 RepID=A0ABS0MZ54_9SPHN|nr:TIGR02281 family clan AA aspartic protease [Aurantiacibacter sediminis]MBH5321000.1 TIGR02281 family clan AA aspartic protease [Aurantiacibacter sediminis]
MDIRVPFACVLIAGGVVAFMMPVADDAANGANASALAETAADTGDAQLASLEMDTPATWNDQVRLDREGDGHFYAEVFVDGTPSRMMVDTGASVIALTGDDAAAMGLYWDESEVGPVAQGASGVVYGVHTQLSTVRLGNFEARDVQAMIIPEGLGISLLGQSFLSTINSVEIADDRMLLESERP